MKTRTRPWCVFSNSDLYADVGAWSQRSWSWSIRCSRRTISRSINPFLIRSLAHSVRRSVCLLHVTCGGEILPREKHHVAGRAPPGRG